MNRRTDILNELRSMDSPLAQMSSKMPYTVPAGYFEELTSYTQESIRATKEKEPVTSWGKEMPFHVHEGYFSSLPVIIKATIIAEEQKSQLSKDPGFSTPEGYFEHLPKQILAAVKASEEKQLTKRIPLGVNIWKNIRFAAAAVLLLSIGFGSYKVLQNDKSYDAEKALAQVSDNTINQYVQQHIDEFDSESIENVVASNTNISGLATGTLSDEDIILYLDEAGWGQTEIN